MSTILEKTAGCFPGYEKYLNNKDVDKSVKKISQKGDKGKKLASFIKDASNSNEWQDNATAVKLVNKAVKAANKTDKKKSQKKLEPAVRQLKDLTKLDQVQAKAPAGNLHIAEISTDKNWNIVKKTVAQWEKIAKAKEKLAVTLSADRQKIDTFEDSDEVCEQLKKGLKKREAGDILYIAYDDTNNLQGAVLVLREPANLDIPFLVTAPKNIQLLSNESPLKGIGLALLLHIGKQMVDENIPKLTLESYPTAMGFYQHLGFTQTGGTDGGLTPFEMTLEKMTALIAARPNAAIIDQKEPKLKKV